MLREEKSLSQSELSRLSGVSQRNISNWENKKSLPNILELLKLADFFQISIDELIGRTNDYGFIEIKAESTLSIEEKEVIKAYNQLDPEDKEIFIELLYSMIKKKTP